MSAAYAAPPEKQNGNDSFAAVAAAFAGNKSSVIFVEAIGWITLCARHNLKLIKLTGQK